MMWGYVPEAGTDALHKVENILRKESFVEMIVKKVKTGCGWVFLVDLLQNYWLQDNRKEVLKWSSQNPDLSTTEKL